MLNHIGHHQRGRVGVFPEVEAEGDRKNGPEPRQNPGLAVWRHGIFMLCINPEFTMCYTIFHGWNIWGIHHEHLGIFQQ